MIDISKAFSHKFAGVSFWELPDGRVQCNLRRRNQTGTFSVGVGATVQEAWCIALGMTPPKPIRNDEDLL